MCNMDRTVSTETLFESNEDYSKMNDKEKRNYVNKLSKEFIKNARDLLENLKDK